MLKFTEWTTKTRNKRIRGHLDPHWKRNAFSSLLLCCHISIAWLGNIEEGNFWGTSPESGDNCVTCSAARLWFSVWRCISSSFMTIQKKHLWTTMLPLCCVCMLYVMSCISGMVMQSLQRWWRILRGKKRKETLGDLTLVGAQSGANLYRDVQSITFLKHQHCLPSGWWLRGTFSSCLKSK